MKLSIDSKLLVAALVVAGCGAASQAPAPPANTAAPVAEASAAPAAPAEVSPTAEASAAAPASAVPATDPAPGKADLATGRKTEKGGSLRQRLMKLHFNQTATIRDAVISGRLHNAVSPASLLTNMEGVETLPKLWRRSVQQLQVASRRIRQGSDLQEIAAATADIGRACATCHAAAGGPTIKVGTPPGGGATMADRMKRHMWATERLWEGIYGPSDEAWKAGAAALELDPFPKKELSKGGVHALSSAARFSKHAKHVGDRKTGEQRAKLYASLLATCSPCHDAMGVGK